MTISLRQGTPGDNRAVFEVFIASLIDLGDRLGVETITGGAEDIEKLWAKREPIMTHAANTADKWWVAEDGGRVVGYARSTLRDGIRQLTEFFVRPDVQSAGIGRGLLERVFPAEGARGRLLLATQDPRALARYLKAGMLARFPVYHFSRSRRDAPYTGDLEPAPISADPYGLAMLASIDREVLGFRRDADHRWLLSTRKGFVYLRNGSPVGYGYVGLYQGPFAALDPAAIGTMLSHAESVAEGEEFGVEAPLINRAALQYLFEHGFRMDPFVNFFLSDVEAGKFDRYVVTTPSLFI
ncbi:MAG TPA: GNAT family N-acetyltransferase [Gemmatimonadales bacterium]|nr:GNAT family N-acetyltransferase [Gemmatimonadales bacterium]